MSLPSAELQAPDLQSAYSSFDPQEHRPSLRNVALRRAFFHNGVFRTLRQMLGPFNSEVQRIGLLSYARIFFS